jgi:exodeoxyribonuclease VII large subunit
MQQITGIRLRTAQHALQHLACRLPSAGSNALERRACALGEAVSRFQRLHLAERFVSESGRIEQLRVGLQRSSGQRLASARAELDGEAGDLRSRVAARLSTARLTLAPRAHRLRSTLEVRARTTATRLEAALARLRAAGTRELNQRVAALARLRDQLSLERVQPHWERERAVLEQHVRVLRASDPQRALARGFSLTYTASGALLRSIHEAAPGESITTRLVDGMIRSAVLETRMEKGDERED